MSQFLGKLHHCVLLPRLIHEQSARFFVALDTEGPFFFFFFRTHWKAHLKISRVEKDGSNR